MKLTALDRTNVIQKNKLEKLKIHEYDPNCKYCINNIFVKDAIETKEELQKKFDEYAEVKRLLDGINKVLSLKKFINIEKNFEDILKSQKPQFTVVKVFKSKDGICVIMKYQILDFYSV